MTTWTERAAESAIDYDIQPQYERALGGFHPDYFPDVDVLAQDGWDVPWQQMWADRASISASWTERAATSATWNERT